MKRAALLLVAPLAFVVVALPGAQTRGVIAEEVQPYLPRWPRVLERSPEGIRLMPPDEPGAPPRPRWVSTSQWPVVGYDGVKRMWPVLIRGYQSSLGACVGLFVGPLLGDGLAGVRRSHVLLTAIIVLFTSLLLGRLKSAEPGPPSPRFGPWALLAGLLLAGSFGQVFVGRTGYGYEIASRAAMMAALLVAAPKRPLTGRRALAVGALAGLSLVCRATILTAVAPALAVLLLARARWSGWPRLMLVGTGAAAVPLGVLALTAALSPLRPDTRPLAGLRWEGGFARLLSVFDQLSLQLAWVWDGRTVTGPLARGEVHLPAGPLAVAAALGFLPLAVGLYRWLRRQETEVERLYVVTTVASAVLGVVLYGSPNQFQLALALEPLFALAVAAQLEAVAGPRPRWALGLALAVLAVRGYQLTDGLLLDRRNLNPMLSGKAQREAVAHLEAVGVSSDELVTTSYQHAGVVETWSDGRLRPVHAWPLFMHSGSSKAEVWRQLLAARHPRYLLLTEGPNLFETPGLEPGPISSALQEVAREQGRSLEVEGHFRTEGGGPGWVVWRLGDSRP